jgi:hypothetical protein
MEINADSATSSRRGRHRQHRGRSSPGGVSDVCDDRWHFVATYDGTSLRLYVDGVLEATSRLAGRSSVGGPH